MAQKLASGANLVRHVVFPISERSARILQPVRNIRNARDAACLRVEHPEHEHAAEDHARRCGSPCTLRDGDSIFVNQTSMKPRKHTVPKIQPLQGCLFEEDFLVRTLGSIAQSSEVALTELVANAWDAGAAEVKITVPEDEDDDTLIIEDDGSGMTPEQFHQKWMTLGYDRVRHQGRWAEFPPDRADWKRPAYGRNGVGRHGMLCFSATYEVETRRNSILGRFTVATSSGKEPFTVTAERVSKGRGHGTKLRALVTKNLPSAERVRNILSVRFLHDPRFTVVVNGKSVHLSEHKGLVDQAVLPVDESAKAEAYFIDSTKSAKTTQYQGVAFWVGGRLVGEPAWAVRTTVFLDGRTRIAKRYSVVVKSDDFFDEVLPDWSGFKKSERVERLYAAVAEYVDKVFKRLSTERIQDTTESVFREHRNDLDTLKPLARLEISEFVEAITNEHPTIQPEMLSAAVKAVINIEKMRAGASLLDKIARLSDEDVQGLDRLLGEWSVRDALTVLDEIDRRLVVIEAIGKLSADSKVDELHSLHPLVTEARWLFGQEFDTPEFAANVSLTTAMQKVFAKRPRDESFTNPRKRADLICLADATVSGVATEQVNEQSGLVEIRDILLIELKRGSSKITRENIHQASDYVEDLLRSGLLDGTPYFRAFVVGHSIDEKVEPKRSIGENPVLGRVQAATYGQLVRSAQKRLFRLRERLASRYEEVTGTDLLARVLAEPHQIPLGVPVGM